MNPIHIGSTDYHKYNHNPDNLIKVVDIFTKLIEKLPLRPAALAFSGASGCALGFPISLITEIPTIYVRKESEKSHGVTIEGAQYITHPQYVIVDDCISSGDTVNRIEKQLYCNYGLECVGIILINGWQNGSDHKFPNSDRTATIYTTTRGD